MWYFKKYTQMNLHNNRNKKKKENERNNEWMKP